MGAVTAMPGWTSHGAGNGAGPTVNIFDGVPVTIVGTVASIGYSGQGMEIDTGTDIVTVYAIGPVRFWNDIGIARPGVGEDVSIDGYEVTFSDGSTKIIVYSVTIGEDTVMLRDKRTGAPAWRGLGHTSGLMYHHECQNQNRNR